MELAHTQPKLFDTEHAGVETFNLRKSHLKFVVTQVHDRVRCHSKFVTTGHIHIYIYIYINIYIYIYIYIYTHNVWQARNVFPELCYIIVLMGPHLILRWILLCICMLIIIEINTICQCKWCGTVRYCYNLSSAFSCAPFHAHSYHHQLLSL